MHRGILALALGLALTLPAQAEYTFRPFNSGGGSGIGTVNGIVKGDGAGNPSAAVAGTDYVSPALTSGRIYVGSAGNLATGVPMGGDCTIIAAGTITCTKINGATIGTMALQNANAVAITGGTFSVATGFFSGVATSASAFTLDNGSVLANWQLNGTGDPILNVVSAKGLDIRTTNLPRLYVSATGSVGVGTTSPAYQVQVGNASGAQVVTASGGASGTDGGAFFAKNGAVTIGAFGNYSLINGGAYNADATIYADNASNIWFTHGATERMRIATSGNVGIGTASPSAQLHTTGTVRFANYTCAGGGGTLTVDGSGNLACSDAATMRALIGLGTIATQNANNVTISGGSINGTTVGASTPATGKFTTLEATSGVKFDGLGGAGTLCASLDPSGNMGRTACGGTGLPGAGSLSQVIINSAAGTGIWATEPYTNITALTGADCTGVAATVISTVIGSIKSIALPTDCTLRVTGNDTIAAGVFFAIPCGARIQVDGAAILTFSGETDDNECQKFSASGAGAGAGGGTVRGLTLNRPEWWGAFGDCNYAGACTHDDSGPLQQAFNSVRNANSSSGGVRAQVKLGCSKGYGVSTGIVATASRDSPLLISGCAPLSGGNSEAGSALYGRSGFTGQVLTVTVTGSVSTNIEIRDFEVSSINNFQADACLQIGSAGNTLGNAAGHSFAHNLRLTNCKHLLKFAGSVVSFQFDRIWMVMGNNGATSGANASCIEAVPNAEALSELTFNAIACDNSPNSDASAICLNFHSQGASGGITGTRINDVSCYSSTTGLVLNADGASLIADFWCYSCQMDALRANSTGYYLATTGTATMADVVLDRTYATNVGAPFDVLNIDGSAGGTIKNIGVYGFYSAVGGAFRAIRVNNASQVNIQGARIGGTYTSQGILLNNCTGCQANNGIFSGTAPVFALLGGSTDYSQACNNTASGALAPASVSSNAAAGTHNNYYNAPGLQHCPNN